MRRLILYVSLLIAALPVAAAAKDIRGAWSAVAKGDTVQLNLVRNDSRWGRTWVRPDIPLTDEQIYASTETPVSFSLSRDAGTIAFSGTFQTGEGVGRFSFTPNPTYATTLRSLGVTFDEALDDEGLFSLAMHNVSAKFIGDMQSLGYRESLDDYIAFRIHGVTVDFVRELRSLGYDKLTAEDLVTFRIHGVTPQFIRSLKELGYTEDAEQLVAFRIHGVSPDFVRSMRDLRVKDLSSEQLVAMRIHGVSTEYVRELRDLGYTGLESDDLVSMRIHGVSTRFIRELANAGYHNVPVEKLIAMRIHGLDASLLGKEK